jgi:FKBP-type peptidyl-prolyl cis-trans isomerase
LAVRSPVYLLLLGLMLGTVAIVVRSGIFMRKNPGEPINAAMRLALADVAYQWSPADAALLARDYAGAYETPGHARYFIRHPGTGDATPRAGQIVTVNYEGRFLSDGRKFDSSADNGGPYNFTLGRNQTLTGWDECLLTMKKGERRTVVLPYWLAYGEKGLRNKVPGHASVVFDLELVDFR